jgi:rubrerythrin
MTASINAQDVLDMAVRIERNAQAFYRAAAAATGDESIRTLLNALAQWEDSHGDALERLRDASAEGGDEFSLADPGDGMADYFRALARDFPFLVDESAAKPSAGMEDTCGVLSLALDMERATVLFFAGVRTLVSGADSKQIDRVIQEEIEHAMMLSKGSSGL